MQSRLLTKVRPNGQEDTPKLRLDIDYEKAAAQGVPYASINATLGAAWGGLYVDDFIDRGRVKRVYVQSDAPFRMVPDDFKQLVGAQREGRHGAALVVRELRAGTTARRVSSATTALRPCRSTARPHRA